MSNVFVQNNEKQDTVRTHTIYSKILFNTVATLLKIPCKSKSCKKIHNKYEHLFQNIKKLCKMKKFKYFPKNPCKKYEIKLEGTEPCDSIKTIFGNHVHS